LEGEQSLLSSQFVSLRHAQICRIAPLQVNLELVDLTPPPKIMASKEKEASSVDAVDGGIKHHKKEKEKEKLNGDYFIQVNEHKKGLR
jgi:hypothetical protein